MILLFGCWGGGGSSTFKFWLFPMKVLVARFAYEMKRLYFKGNPKGSQNGFWLLANCSEVLSTGILLTKFSHTHLSSFGFRAQLFLWPVFLFSHLSKHSFPNFNDFLPWCWAVTILTPGLTFVNLPPYQAPFTINMRQNFASLNNSNHQNSTFLKRCQMSIIPFKICHHA